MIFFYKLKELQETIAEVWEEETKTYKDKMLPMTKREKYDYNRATHCYICSKKFTNHQSKSEYREHYEEMKRTNTLQSNCELDLWHLGPKVDITIS